MLAVQLKEAMGVERIARRERQIVEQVFSRLQGQPRVVILAGQHRQRLERLTALHLDDARLCLLVEATVLDWIALAQRWSMLDVFGLALAVFALESEGLMRTEVSWGALALIGLLVLQRAFQRAHERNLRGEARGGRDLTITRDKF